MENYTEWFLKAPKIVYEGAKTDNPLAFRYYNPDEVIGGKTMREQLRFAMSYWHTMCAGGTDMFGVNTMDKSYGGGDPVDAALRKADAAFALMDTLDMDFYCFHDRDLVDEADNLKETNARLDKVTDRLESLMKQTGKKVLWGTANCFGNPRYVHGAGTAPNADTFAFAAAQIKKAVEITTRLKGEGYVFWGGREGYETLLNTDMALEQENMARLLRMTVDYARSIGFEGDFYIEPKPKEPTKHQYDFDASTVLAFLRRYGLEKDLKLNIEANHATLAGHTFQHELAVARINDAFGSIDANQGDLLLGWDTDQFPTNIYDTTLCMLEVLKAGGFTHGGLNFDAKTRRGSFGPEDILYGYIAGMDAYALGFRMADRILRDGRIQDMIDARYASWNTGIGSQIRQGTATMQQLEDYALSLGDVSTNVSGRQEYLEHILNSIMFG